MVATPCPCDVVLLNSIQLQRREGDSGWLRLKTAPQNEKRKMQVETTRGTTA